jgi:hypothetical protein
MVPMRRITVVATIEVPRPPEAVLPAIWDIKNIERCEVKADHVEVHPADREHGTYDVTGRFAGVPWRGQFEYETDARGFHSRTAGVPRSEAKVEGGFLVTPLGDGASTVIHYEQYVLARWLRPVTWLIVGYLRWSMRPELRALRDLVVDSTSAVDGPSLAVASS